MNSDISFDYFFTMLVKQFCITILRWKMYPLNNEHINHIYVFLAMIIIILSALRNFTSYQNMQISLQKQNNLYIIKPFRLQFYYTFNHFKHFAIKTAYSFIFDAIRVKTHSNNISN